MGAADSIGLFYDKNVKHIIFASASMVSLALILLSCGGAPQAPDSRTNAMNGTVQNWTKGAATVELSSLTGKPALTSTGLNASGRFNLTLPSPSALSGELQITGSSVINEDGCTGGFASSDPQALGLTKTSLNVTRNGSTIATIQPAVTHVTEKTSTRVTAEIKGNAWIYVDRPTQLSGSVRCSDTSQGAPITLNFSVNTSLRTGWNVLNVGGTVVATPSSGDITINYSNGQDGPTTWTEETSGSVPLSMSVVPLKHLFNVANIFEKAPLFGK